jgi:hypothetical protein
MPSMQSRPSRFVDPTIRSAGKIVLICGLIVALGAIIGLSVEFYSNEHKEKHWVAWFSSGCIVVRTGAPSISALATTDGIYIE